MRARQTDAADVDDTVVMKSEVRVRAGGALWLVSKGSQLGSEIVSNVSHDCASANR
jgi:hypothetical protein